MKRCPSGMSKETLDFVSYGFDKNISLASQTGGGDVVLVCTESSLI